MLCNHHCATHRIATTTKAIGVGAAIGLVFGMLFARRSGKELRSNLSKAGEKKGLRGAAELLGAELKLMGRDAVETGKEVAQSDTVQDAVKKGQRIVRDVKEKGASIVKRVEDEVE